VTTAKKRARSASDLDTSEVQFEKRLYRHRGITIIQKKDPRLRPIRPTKVGLVLAGGAISGGAYKVGGLRALDEIFAQRRVPGHGSVPFSLTDSDVFVGLSAGSVLASVLAAGIPPDEILRITLGTSSLYEEFTRWQFMAPNVWEPLQRFLPWLSREHELFTNWLSGATDPARVAPYTLRLTMAKMLEAVSQALPTGIFSTHRLGEYLRRNMERAGIPDDFAALHARTGKSLYLTAVDLNKGQMLAFGHDEPYGQVPVSDAVRASCALPGWYRPVRLENPRKDEPGEPPFFDLTDGGVMRTANVRVAVEKGAELVICYNPFVRLLYDRVGRSLIDHGPYALFSQVFRILLGARLDLAKELLYRDETVDADIVFIEPTDDDAYMFRMNPVDFGTKDRAAQHGYRTIRAAIQSNHEQLAEVFATHGIELHPPAPDREHMPGDDAFVDEDSLRESRGAHTKRQSPWDYS
jgi:predicted acylesterase/phospholipase RssA